MAGRSHRMVLVAGSICALALALPSVAGATSTFAWGNAASGALGIEGAPSLVWEPALQPLGGVSSVAAGSQFGLAISAGGVYSWGQNFSGQLGDGGTANGPTPAPVSGLGGATAVVAGGSFAGALTEDGAVEAWGANGQGQLGQGSHSGPESCSSSACSTVPLEVPGLSHVTAIGAGRAHVLALLEDGTVEAWGANSAGQLGDGTTAEKDSPVAVSGLSEVVAVAAGGGFSLALLANGEVRAWGNGGSGQLGDGSTGSSSTPVAVSGLSGVTAISAGEAHALALLANGEVRSWGENERGQLGNGTHVDSDVPVAVSGLGGASAVAAGWEHSLAIVAGAVEAWGSNWEAQLGNGKRREGDGPYESVDVPAPVACGLEGIEGIAAGRAQSYAWGETQETCPSVAGVAPREGLEAGGTEVTIAGSQLGAATGVSFGSTPAISFVVESSTRIAAISPPGAEGTVDIRVTTARGRSPLTERDRFSYGDPPTVTQVSPSFATAGASVTVTGTNLSTVTAVRFGTVVSSNVTIHGDRTLTVTAPPGEGPVDVTVTNPVGTSAVSSADEFMYRTLYEFGRCVKVAEGGEFGDKGCTGDGPKANVYDWYPAAFGAHPLDRSGVNIASGSLTVETAAKLKLTCTGVQGSGQIAAYDRVAVEHLTLTGCASPKLGACSSIGAADGEVRAAPVTELLGRTEGGLAPMALIAPASGEVLAQMSCGSHSLTVTGSFVAQIGKANRMVTSQKLKAKQHKGVPAVTELVNRPAAAAGVSLDGGAAQQAGVKLTATQAGEEALEIR